MNRFRLAVFTLLVTVPTISVAQPTANTIRYNFIELGATGGEIEVSGFQQDIDFVQASISGSWGVHENIALTVSSAAGEIETADVGMPPNIDTTAASLGAIIHFPATAKLDIVLPVAFLYAEADDGITSVDDTGFSIGIGLRALVNPSFELAIGALHVDVGDDDEQGISGSARWHITDLFSLAFRASASSDVTSATLSGRWTF